MAPSWIARAISSVGHCGSRFSFLQLIAKPAQHVHAYGDQRAVSSSDEPDVATGAPGVRLGVRFA